DEFRAQLIEAMAAGCSGFAVGRALWREAVDPATRADFLAGTFQERLSELIDIVESAAPGESTTPNSVSNSDRGAPQNHV
ncbi:MAG: hypothetical protein AAFO29_07250, partial [Actinomycetota bacterium]